MLVSCWSVKGGSGTTVVAAALALLLARSSPSGAVAVDLADPGGDLSLALGLPVGAPAPGLRDWLSAAPDVAADGLARLEQPVAPGLTLLERGDGPLDRRGAGLLAGLLADDRRPVVADCGRLVAADGDAGAVAAAVAAAGAPSLLVVRPCFLALRRAADAPLRPTGVVLVTEPGRSLRARDVEDVVGVPVIAEVRVRDDIARAVDAGLLALHVPRALAHDLRAAS